MQVNLYNKYIFFTMIPDKILTNLFDENQKLKNGNLKIHNPTLIKVAIF